MGSQRSCSVVILGGGMAGLSAALELAGRGLSVLVLEKAADVGGRCQSDVQNPERSGNPVHLVPGWFLNTRALMQHLGTDSHLKPHAAAAVFRRGAGELSRASALSLPKPFSLLNQRFPWYSGFSVQERVSSLATASMLASATGDRLEQLDEVSLRSWSGAFNAGVRPFIRHMLDPFTLHSLTTIDQDISSRTASVVLRSRLLGPGPYVSSFTEGPVADLVQPLAAYVQSQGVEIRTNCAVSRIVAGRTRIERIETERDVVSADFVVSALTPDGLRNVISPEMLRFRYFRNLSELRMRTLVTVLCYFDRPIVDFDEPLYFAESLHGLYCRLVNAPKKDQTEVTFACVVTRSDAFFNLTPGQLSEAVISELTSLVPHLRPEWLLRVEVFRNSTSSCLLHLPGGWKYRPTTRSPFGNLFLAGDWTRQAVDLASLEGAILSGRSAGQAVLRELRLDTRPLLEVDKSSALQLLHLPTKMVTAPLRSLQRLVSRVERREIDRIEMALDGYLEDLESHVGWTPILILNISRLGVFFVSEASPRIGATVRLRINTGQGNEVKMRGKVLGVEETYGSTGGRIGVRCRVRPQDDHSQQLWMSLQSDR